MKKVLIVGLVLVGSISIGWATENNALWITITGEELYYRLQQSFPHLKNGETIFVTTGWFHAYSLSFYEQVFEQVRFQLPPCRYKAALVVLGELHLIDKLIAAGLAMGRAGSPAWFILIVAMTANNKDIDIYGLDPIGRRIWKVQARDVALIII